MRKQFVWALAVSVLGFGCGDDDAVGTPLDSGSGADSASGDGGTSPDGGVTEDGGDTGDGGGTVDDGGTTDGGGDDAGTDPVVERGRYLVNHVAVCIDCHTPRNEDGSLDTTRLLAGSPSFADIDMMEGVGNIPAPNLTPHETGLGDWTADEIKNAFLNGVKKDGTALFPIMPYFVFHNMADADADAIVAYLMSLAPIDNDVGVREPLGFPFQNPAMPIPEAMIPNTTLPTDDANYDSAVRGRYLAGSIGICLECHTPRAMGAIPRDLTKLFAGGEEFSGFPSPPFPDPIVSANITPHSTGIEGWTAEQVRTALKMGTDIEGAGICPPMPVGPMGAFGGLTDEDALDIGNYITTLPPIDNTIASECSVPSM